MASHTLTNCWTQYFLHLLLWLSTALAELVPRHSEVLPNNRRLKSWATATIREQRSSCAHAAYRILGEIGNASHREALIAKMNDVRRHDHPLNHRARVEAWISEALQATEVREQRRSTCTTCIEEDSNENANVEPIEEQAVDEQPVDEQAVMEAVHEQAVDAKAVIIDLAMRHSESTALD